MYPVVAWVTHPVHICHLIVVVFNHHAHCTSVSYFGSGTAPGLQQSFFTPTPKFCCKLCVTSEKALIPCFLLPVYVNNFQYIEYGCIPVHLLVHPIPNVCWNIGMFHQGSYSWSNHGEPYLQAIPLWGFCTCVIKVDFYLPVFPIFHLL